MRMKASTMRPAREWIFEYMIGPADVTWEVKVEHYLKVVVLSFGDRRWTHVSRLTASLNMYDGCNLDCE